MSLLEQFDFSIHFRGNRKLSKNTVLHLEEVRKHRTFLQPVATQPQSLLQSHVEYKRVLCLIVRQTPATCMRKSQIIPQSRMTVTIAASLAPRRMGILSTTRSSLISTNRKRISLTLLWVWVATAANEQAPHGSLWFPLTFLPLNI